MSTVCTKFVDSVSNHYLALTTQYLKSYLPVITSIISAQARDANDACKHRLKKCGSDCSVSIRVGHKYLNIKNKNYFHNMIII